MLDELVCEKVLQNSARLGTEKIEKRRRRQLVNPLNTSDFQEVFFPKFVITLICHYDDEI